MSLSSFSVAGIQQEVCRQEEGVADQLVGAQEGEENGGTERGRALPGGVL